MARRKPKANKAQRPRSARRQALRELDKLAQQRRKLHALEPGGQIDHPIEVASTSLIDMAVRGLHCAGCNDSLLRKHEVGHVRAGRVLRTVELSCRQCGEPRIVYFALKSTPTVN